MPHLVSGLKKLVQGHLLLLTQKLQMQVHAWRISRASKEHFHESTLQCTECKRKWLRWSLDRLPEQCRRHSLQEQQQQQLILACVSKSPQFGIRTPHR